MISIHAPRAGSDARIVPACSSRSTFQSTLPVRGATQKGMNYDKVLNISIHAPRAGSDNSRAVGFPFKIHFNPRSPCGERLLPIAFSLALVYFNPRSPCGERLILWEVHSCNFNFNPRSPCGERPGLGSSFVRRFGFQSTLPVRGATSVPAGRECKPCDFNPRSPCGERHVRIRWRIVRNLFQSTLPVRGATNLISDLAGFPEISIHAPRAGSDLGL